MESVPLRSGFGYAGGGDDPSLATVAALLRSFSKEAIRVSGDYAIGNGRRSVGAEDMKRALKYCARTFFEKSDDELARRVEAEMEEMKEEEEEEDDEGEEDDEEGEDDTKSGEENTESGEDDTEEEKQIRKQLVLNVDRISLSWDSWDPVDPVHKMIKRAIDKTPVPN